MVTVVEKCLTQDANAPKWEVYVNGKLEHTVTDKRYLNAVVRLYK